MSLPVDQISAAAKGFGWLLNRFSSETDGVLEVIAVSSDGLLMAMSTQLDRSAADRLAAIASAISSLASGASRCYDFGDPVKSIMELDRGYLLVSSISLGSSLGVLATKAGNLGTIAYEMTMFTNRAGAVLTPQLIVELRSSVEAGAR